MPADFQPPAAAIPWVEAAIDRFQPMHRQGVVVSRTNVISANSLCINR